MESTHSKHLKPDWEVTFLVLKGYRPGGLKSHMTANLSLKLKGFCLLLGLLRALLGWSKGVDLLSTVMVSQGISPVNTNTKSVDKIPDLEDRFELRYPTILWILTPKRHKNVHRKPSPCGKVTVFIARDQVGLLLRWLHPDGKWRHVQIDCGKTFRESVMTWYKEHQVPPVCCICTKNMAMTEKRLASNIE